MRWQAAGSASQSVACARGQAATETLVLVAFALIFILPIVFLFLSASGSELSKTSVAQAKISARTIADEAGEVYLQGENARKSILVNYPSGVVNGSVENGIVAIRVEQDGGVVDVVSQSFANINGNLSGKRSAGLQKINLKYVTSCNCVNITYG